MNDFAGMEEMLQDFLLEAGELLSDVDNKLVDLEKQPDNPNLLNDIFRGFHTIKGGAGFLNATELVKLCHLTENLFDKLRNRQLSLNPELMDNIMAATGEVRRMFGSLEQSRQPQEAAPALLATLEQALTGKAAESSKPSRPATTAPAASAAAGVAASVPVPAADKSNDGPNWQALYGSLLPGGAVPPPASAATPPISATQAETQVATQVATLEASGQPAPPSFGRRKSDDPVVEEAKSGRRDNDKVVAAKETTIRVDTDRLDQVLTLSGEIGLTKNRLSCLRRDLLKGKTGADTMRSLDEAVSELELLVGNLQNAVMKTRMQPIGRLFLKYPRMARDLARQLGKDVELALSGEETEIDKTMIEDLNDPLVHLVRNSVDHGVEDAATRASLGKPAKSVIKLSARQEGDHIYIEITDDGRGMSADLLRSKAVEKGLISAEAANGLDDSQALQLILLPGFTTKQEISSVSGRGVGMDVVKTNIQRLNGRIDIVSSPGQGTTITVALPLTLAILPVLLVRLGEQPFAVPLAMVREIVSIFPEQLQEVSGRATMLVRGEVLPVLSLAAMLGWNRSHSPECGVLLQLGNASFILAVDGFAGHDDVVIKPLDTFKPKGVAGATMSSEGKIVLILDLKELLGDFSGEFSLPLVQRTEGSIAA